MKQLLAASAVFLLMSLPARAVEVVATIGPIHSWAASVMGDVGTPHLLIRGEASPHTYSLSPGDAGRLAEADLVITIGPELERFLDKPLSVLSPDAVRLDLIRAPGLIHLLPRSGGAFEGHGGVAVGHDHGHDHGEGHDHPDGVREVDAHVWLHPDNAKAGMAAIAEALAQIDPENATTYLANAAAGAARMDALKAGIAARFEGLAPRPFIVFHDAYQYFEDAFNVPAAGAVSVQLDTPPGPRRLAELQALVRESDAACLFDEPQFDGKVMEMIADGLSVYRGRLDPLGAGLTPGPAQYDQILHGLADSLIGCFTADS